MLAKTSFLVDSFEQCFRVSTLMIFSLCGCSGQPYFQSSLFQPASVRAPTVKFCSRFHWKPSRGAGPWPSAPLKKAIGPAGKVQGGVFPPRFWLLSRPFSVCGVSPLFFRPLKNTVTLLLGHIRDVGNVFCGGGGVRVGLVAGSPAVLFCHCFSCEGDLMRTRCSPVRYVCTS